MTPEDEAHYFFTLMEFAELIRAFRYNQVLYDLNEYQKIKLYAPEGTNTCG